MPIVKLLLENGADIVVMEDTITNYSYGTEIDNGILHLLTNIMGNIYNAVQIGNQTWMIENLKSTRYADSTAIPNITDNTEWENLEDNDTDKAFFL